MAFWTAAAAQRPPTIAAAANLNFALTEIEDQFARERGTPVEIVFGASGTLTRQIRDGAPFELFLAADEEFPKQLTAAGLTRDAGVVYAVGRLAVFAPTGSPLTVDARLEGLARLVKAGNVGKFAIANPDVAPYGKAAEAVLRKRGLWDAHSTAVGTGRHHRAGGTVRDDRKRHRAASSPIRSCSVPASPIAARTRSSLRVDHPPLRQRMVLLKRAGATAAQFYTYLQGDTARAILRKHGYGVPQ